MNDDLTKRLRAKALDPATDDHTAALLIEAADAYLKLRRLWAHQIGQVAKLEHERDELLAQIALLTRE